LLEADRSDDALFRGGQSGYQFWSQSDEVSNSIRLGPQQNYGNVVLWQMLLKRQIPVDRNKYVKFCCGQGQQLAV